MLDAEQAAEDVGVSHLLHLWPDEGMGTKAARAQFMGHLRLASSPTGVGRDYGKWLSHYWGRVSEWPGKCEECGKFEAIKRVRGGLGMIEEPCRYCSVKP